ncbi:MAG TPA: type II secretion system protein GspK [Alicycliphilus sp.]|nr:type II secretion system protein GspK [Alicycliphilus sp.]
MALIMVLWVTAALAIVVTSIGYMVRGELRQVAAVRAGAADRAIGRAAIVLALQEFDASNVRRLDRPERRSYQVGSTTVDVLALPLNGLLDINRAPVALLAALFRHAGGLPPDTAQNLAAALVEMRTARTPQGAVTQFDAIEDLLQLSGVDYELYARLAPLITVNAGGSSQVNPYAAPTALLTVLAEGNQAAVAAFEAGRDSGTADQSGFNPAFLTPGGSNRLRLYARPVEGAQDISTVACDVTFFGRRSGALPWEVPQCDAPTTPMW